MRLCWPIIKSTATLIVPASYKTADGCWLNRWFCTQRQRLRDAPEKLTPDQRQKLEQLLGPDRKDGTNSMQDRGWIDLHSHILPQLDDGSDSVEMSLPMLYQMAEQGVDVVCATSHYYAKHSSIPAFCERRAEAMERLSAVPDGGFAAGASSGGSGVLSPHGRTGPNAPVHPGHPHPHAGNALC